MKNNDLVAISNQQREPVSIVIVNYNAGAYLVECVTTALLAAEEVIIVDNGSSDNSLSLVKTKLGTRSDLNIICTRRNLGFASACAIGSEEATQKYILFLNPDCELKPGTLGRLVQELEKDSKIGMVGGLLTNADGLEQGGGRRAVPTPWRSFVRAFGLNRLADRWPRLFYDFHLHKQPLPAAPVEVEAISGALMLVRREAIVDVGQWDDGYFLHCEDLDWCMRFRQKGWKIIFVPDAPVVHHQGACSRSRPVFVEYYKHKGMSRFYNKFFRHQYPGILMWLVTAGVWLRFSFVVLFYWLNNTFNKFKPDPS